MKKISGVYKIENIITGDFYIGSSKNVKRRWTAHKSPSKWSECPNSPLYQDMQKYGVDKFDFQILENMEPERLKKKEQEFIETLNPTYNNINAKGWDIERKKEWEKSEKGKKSRRKYYKRICSYNGETLTVDTLRMRFQRAGIPHPTIEAKKYLEVK